MFCRTVNQSALVKTAQRNLDQTSHPDLIVDDAAQSGEIVNTDAGLTTGGALTTAGGRLIAEDPLMIKKINGKKESKEKRNHSCHSG